MIFATVVVFGLLALLITAGLFVDWLIDRGKHENGDRWTNALFMGTSFVIVIGQFFAYNGVTLDFLARFFWILPLGGLVLLVTTAKKMPTFNALLYLAGLGVFVVNGFGLWISGIETYLGRGWGDQGNYVAIAHYLTYYPFGSLPPSTDPAAVVGSAYNFSRHGPSVLMAVLSEWLGLSPKPLLEPALMIAPVLLFLSFAEMSKSQRLPERYGIVASAAIACLPALVGIHLEGFISQVFGTAYLGALVMFAARASRTALVADYVRTAFIFGAGLAVYPEYLPFYCVPIGFGAAAALMGNQKARQLFGMALVIAIPLLLQSGNDLLRLFGSGNMGTSVLNFIFPWATQPLGLVRLVFGDVAQEWMFIPVLLMTALGYIGLMRMAWQRVDVVAVASAVTLAVAPWVILLSSPDATYQFYKVGQTVAPFVVWGLAVLLWQLAPKWHAGSMVFVAIGALWTMAALEMIIVSTDGSLAREELKERRQVAVRELLHPDFKTVQGMLWNTHSRDIIACINDGSANGSYTNLWLAIAAGRGANRVWSMNPQVNEQRLTHLLGPAFLPKFPPNRPLFVTTRDRAARFVGKDQPDQMFAIREAEAGDLLVCLPDMNNVERNVTVHGSNIIWVYASEDATLEMRYRSNVPVEFSAEGEIVQNPGHWNARVKAGFNQIKITTPSGGAALNEIEFSRSN